MKKQNMRKRCLSKQTAKMQENNERIANCQTMCEEQLTIEAQKFEFVQKDIKNILDLMSNLLYTEAEQQLLIIIEKLGCNKQKQSKYHLYCLYISFYNLAVVNKKLNKNTHAQKSLQFCEEFLETIINLTHSKYQRLVFTIQYIKVSLQLCLLISENGSHQSAAVLVSQIIVKLLQIFKLVKKIIENLERNIRKKQQKNNLIDFRFVVLKQAKQKINYLCKIKNPQIFINQSQQQLTKIALNLYEWKINLENNQKYVRRQLHINHGERRNILGICKNSTEDMNFQLGGILTLTSKQFNFNKNIDPYFLISDNSILEIALYISAAYFIFSSQIRLRETQQICNIKSKNIQQEKLSKNLLITKCKILHLEAIKIAGTFLPPFNKYISHLIVSFNRNYKYFMEKIIESKQQESSLKEINRNSLQLKRKVSKNNHKRQSNNRKKSISNKKQKIYNY